MFKIEIIMEFNSEADATKCQNHIIGDVKNVF